MGSTASRIGSEWGWIDTKIREGAFDAIGLQSSDVSRCLLSSGSSSDVFESVELILEDTHVANSALIPGPYEECSCGAIIEHGGKRRNDKMFNAGYEEGFRHGQHQAWMARQMGETSCLSEPTGKYDAEEGECCQSDTEGYEDIVADPFDDPRYGAEGLDIGLSEYN